MTASNDQLPNPTLKAAVDALQSVLDAVGHPIFVKDEAHRLVVLNESTCELMGHSREELIGRTDYDLVSKEQADLFQKYDRYVFETGLIPISDRFESSQTPRCRI